MSNTDFGSGQHPDNGVTAFAVTPLESLPDYFPRVLAPGVVETELNILAWDAWFGFSRN